MAEYAFNKMKLDVCIYYGNNDDCDKLYKIRVDASENT